MRTKSVCLFAVSLVMASELSFSQTDSLTSGDLRLLLEKSIGKSYQLKIREATVKKAELDKNKAWDAYLPKVTAEGSYTCLDKDVEFPDALKDLLTATQELLIKEQVAMQMQALTTVPDAYKVNFGTAYTNTTLANAVAANLQEISAIQERNVWKANISAQMLVFSGLKVPYSIKAANHQINAMELMAENEKSVIVKDVTTTYDKLAVLRESENVLESTGRLLDEQDRFVTKALKNGLTIELQRQKIELARQQLAYKQVELTNNKKLVIAKLEELSGLPGDTLAAMQPRLADYQLQSMEGSASDRLDVQALDEAITATQYKKASEMTDYIPKIVVYGKKELYTKDLSMLDPGWYVGASVRWTIFDGATAYNASRQTKVDQYILEQKKAEANDLVNLNIKKMSLEVEKSNELVGVTQKQVDIARRSLDLSKKQLDAGLITLNEYLSAVNDLEQARLENIKATYQQRVASIEFLDASGKLTVESVLQNSK